MSLATVSTMQQAIKTTRTAPLTRRAAPTLRHRAVRPQLPTLPARNVAAAAEAPPAELKPPPAAYEAAVAAGVAKANLSVAKIFVLGLLAGSYIALGALLMLSCGGNCPGLASTNPGLKAVVSGLIGLPCGLLMVLIAGGELFTGNTALVTAAALEGKVDLPSLAKSWVVSYAGNLVASVALAWVAVQAGMFATNPAAGGAALLKTSLGFWPVRPAPLRSLWVHVDLDFALTEHSRLVV